MKTTMSQLSSIVGDPNTVHFFTLTEANYVKNAQYKITLKIVNTFDIPTAPASQGFTNPVSISIVSSTRKNFITFATNSNMGKFFISPNGISDFEFDLTPSYSDPNIGTFTRLFFG